MTASLHKISAGDGYTYLTKQVAALDATDLGRMSLSDYYAEKGESPGLWMGNGLAGLTGHGPGYGVAVGSVVREDQMLALFGSGRHPEADRIEEDAIRQGLGKDAALASSQLGRLFSDGSTGEFQRQLAKAYRDHNTSRGLPSRAEIPEPDRARIRTSLALETFRQAHGREPLGRQEFDSHMKREMKGQGRSCAGFDVTFSPVKSISTLWAIAPVEVSRVIEAAQAEAVADAVGWLETEMAFTRRGRAGAQQVETHGFMAAAFVHRDSRAGDPDLHTHVAISNKVQAVADGAWLALDGRAIYQAMVSASERYNSSMERILGRELGLGFVERASDSGLRTIREIDGIAPELAQRWSRRRASINERQTQLVAAFEQSHGRPPTPVEALALAQRATLETREAKHEPRSLGGQRSQWRSEAVEVLGSAEAVDAMASRVLGRRVEYTVVDQLLLERLCRDTVDRVESQRATFQPQHVWAEAERQVRAAQVADRHYRQLADQVVRQVLAAAVPIGAGAEPGAEVPEQLRRSDGASVYFRAHSGYFTTARILEAEEFIRESTQAVDGAVISAGTVEMALLESMANRVLLNPGQAQLVRQFGTSGQRVQLALAPAGSGKTTAMSVLARAWEAEGGTVVALGPTHVAADGLRESMNVTGGTVASLTWALTHDGTLPEWANQLGPESLVVVDEAGMVGTFELATMIAFVLDRGASVRLIGDHQQLAAVAAGGVLREMAEAGQHEVVTLDEVLRFADPAEGRTSLALREGDPGALGFYADRGRIHSVSDATAADNVFEAWRADLGRGWTSLMLAASNSDVAALNELAQQHLISTGRVDPTCTARLRDGNRAGSGDEVVTRTNNQRLRVSATDWVKNRDRWTILEIGADGSLRVQGHRHGRIVTLPAAYVAESVELGYASTVHAAQGMTVDASHILITGTEARQSLYVGLSRGRRENHAWVVSNAPEESDIWAETLEPATAIETLEGILARDGQATSAHGQTRLAADPARQLAHSANAYQDALFEGLAQLVPAGERERIDAFLAEQIPGGQEMRGWPSLRAQMMRLALQGRDPVVDYQTAYASRGVGDARHLVAVMEYRLAGIDPPTPCGPLPWLWPIPDPVAQHPVWGPYLTARAQLVTDQSAAVKATARGWQPGTVPGWARPFLDDPALVARLAVWRAAAGVVEADLTPTGPRASFADDRREQDLLKAELEERLARQGQRDWDLPEAVLKDPYWDVVRLRLNAWVDAGHDVGPAITQALTDAPLPVEHPAAALWWRLETILNSPAPKRWGRRQPPAWTLPLRDQLPPGLLEAITKTPGWDDLADELDNATRDGHDPAQLVETAAALLPQGLETDAIAAMLAIRVQQLSQPPTDQVIDRLHDPEQDHRFQDLPTTRPATPAPTVTPVPPVEVTTAPDPDIAYGPTSHARIVELHQQAAQWYRQQYQTSTARNYLRTRLGTDFLDHPGVVVGYAPAGARLTQYLRSQGATDEELVDAGLATPARNGMIDRFRDRLLLGLHNPAGELVGFVGRARPDADPRVPKYLNTPTTRAFNKGATLFGLHEHADAVAAGAELVRVEGPLDALAISLATDGQAVGVAPLGTALTAAQAELIAQRRDVVWEATDTDKAGLAAAAKDLDRYNTAGITARQLILTPPEQDPTPVKDPAELYARPGGADRIRQAIALGESAPNLAGQVLQAAVAVHAHHLAEDNANVVVAAARQAGRIIAPLAPHLWEEHVTLTVDLITDATHRNNDGDREWLQELVTAETRQAAESWEPPRVTDPYQPAGPRDREPAARAVPQRTTAEVLAAARARLAAIQGQPSAAPSRRDHHQPPQTPTGPSRGRDR